MAADQSGGALVVLHNDDCRPIGQLPKSQVHHAETPLHLAFSCYIFDNADRVLMTHRAISKKTWPGVDEHVLRAPTTCPGSGHHDGRAT